MKPILYNHACSRQLASEMTLFETLHPQKTIISVIHFVDKIERVDCPGLVTARRASRRYMTVPYHRQF